MSCRRAFRRLGPPACTRCGAPGAATGALSCRLCRDWTSLERARASLLFGGAVKRWIHELKYAGTTGLARLAGEPLALSFADAPAAYGAAAALVPVPLHAARRRERGFNQSELLARAAGPRIGLPTLPVLERWRPTRPQIALRPGERRLNVAGAFRVRAELAGFCRGRSLVLVDDVLTTGATLDAAAAALRTAGAGPVLALTLARAFPGPSA